MGHRNIKKYKSVASAGYIEGTPSQTFLGFPGKEICGKVYIGEVEERRSLERES